MLEVRALPFKFDGNIPFQWVPGNPIFPTFLNGLSFFAVGFERYLIKGLKGVLPLIDDAAAKEDAKLFLKQEAQYSLAHKCHVDAMVRLYPGLASTVEKTNQHFDDLYDRENTATTT